MVNFVVTSMQECTNRCCNATTCTLTEGSQCAEGGCCDDCKVSIKAFLHRTSSGRSRCCRYNRTSDCPPQISSQSKECRRKQDDCDLAEYCDGQSATCPEDVFAVNGLPCDGGLGYCFNGNCPQRSDQCVRMYGSGERPRLCSLSRIPNTGEELM